MTNRFSDALFRQSTLISFCPRKQTNGQNNKQMDKTTKEKHNKQINEQKRRNISNEQNNKQEQS